MRKTKGIAKTKRKYDVPHPPYAYKEVQKIRFKTLLALGALNTMLRIDRLKSFIIASKAVLND